MKISLKKYSNVAENTIKSQPEHPEPVTGEKNSNKTPQKVQLECSLLKKAKFSRFH